MALQILENKGTFYVNGKLNSTNTRSFMIHFDYILDSFEHVMINIDHVEEIDLDGLHAIKTLKMIAAKNHKTFSIVGYSCKEIYNDFESNKVA